LAVAVLWLSTGGSPPPFDASSSSPDGYRALSVLLDDAGSLVETLGPTELASVQDGVAGRSVVVPVASWVTSEQLEQLEALAVGGATVVLAGEDGFVRMDDRTLTRTPAQPVGRGVCTIGEFDGLEALDDVSHGFLEIATGAPEEREYCFTESLGLDASGALVTIRSVGAGRIVSLGSPYLWSNARLQPDKEQGGTPLDNGPMAVALLGGSPVTFVSAVAPVGTSPDGTQSPLALLPFNVKLALVQLAFAFVLYAWWRGRRLGRPVREELPVEVAGSELVEAVGGLLRRHGSNSRAADVLRERECRELASRLGVPREAGPDALVAAVASRSARPPAEVQELLFGAPPDGTQGLVALCARLDELHTEVLDVQPTP
jgi:hypothetical protein